MNLPTAIRTRPSRTRLPISQQGLVDTPAAGARPVRLEEKDGAAEPLN